MHRYVDAALFSCDLGLSKPNPGFYAEAIRRLDVRADRCLYVGDGADNELNGAVEAGMDAVLLCAPHERSIVMARAQCRNWMGKTVTDIRQVPALLGLDEAPGPVDAFDVDDQTFEQTLSDSVEHWLTQEAGRQDEQADEQAGEAIIELVEVDEEASAAPPSGRPGQQAPAPASTDAQPPAPAEPGEANLTPTETKTAAEDPAPAATPGPDETAQADPPPPTRRTPRRKKRKGKSPYRAVCFGLFGTLVARPDPRALQRVLHRAAERLGANPADFQRLWLEPGVQHDRHVGTLASPSAAIRHVCAQLGIRPGPDALRHAVTCLFEYAWLELLPAEGVLPVLGRMKSLGWKLACCSACGVETAHYWPRTAFAALLDATVFSCSHRVEATDPDLYRQAAAELGTAPDRCCYLSAQIPELQAAARAGMGAALYAPAGMQGDWDGPVLTDLARVMRVLQ
jgi:putative hydrolase of the HAD superfamily